jgi:hypothetical protein
LDFSTATRDAAAAGAASIIRSAAKIPGRNDISERQGRVRMKMMLVAFCSTSLLLLSSGALVGETPSFEPVQPEVLVQDSHGGLTRAGSGVRLYRAGTRDLLGTGLVDTGGGYASQNVAPVHFGPGEYEERIDVEVTFLTKAGRQVPGCGTSNPAVWQASRRAGVSLRTPAALLPRVRERKLGHWALSDVAFFAASP